MYDLIVIGAGPAGYEAALKARKLNKSVLLVEKHKLGGTCLNYGCIPTKSLLFQTKKYKEILDLKKYGLDIDLIKNDYSKVLTNKKKTVNRLVRGVEYLLKKDGVDLIYDEAKLINKNTVKIGDNEIKAKYILIAVGANEINLLIDGFNNCISSREFLEKDLTKVENVIIIGGGVIGVEFATILMHLGIKTTILEAKEEILSNIDKDAVSLLKKELKKGKVDIITSAKIDKIFENKVICNNKEYKCDFSISCVGRKPNIKDFDINNIVEKNDSFIKVNDKFQTNIDNIYAVGDCIKDYQLAHYASSCANNVVYTIFKLNPIYNLKNIPKCIYCDNEISIVGEDATSNDIIIKQDLVSNPKAIIENENRGFFKLIFDSRYYLKGVTLMCPKSSDMISIFVNALNQKLTYKDIKENVLPHPSFSETFNIM